MKTLRRCLLAVLVMLVAAGFLARKADSVINSAPELFAPGIISTTLDDGARSFTPDGRAFYFIGSAAYTTTSSLPHLCLGSAGRTVVAGRSGAFFMDRHLASVEGEFGEVMDTRTVENRFPSRNEKNVLHEQ